jgi:hypothetical protein
MRKSALYWMAQATLTSEVSRMLRSLISINKHYLLPDKNDEWIRIHMERNDMIVLVSPLLVIRFISLTRLYCYIIQQPAGWHIPSFHAR